VSQHISYVNAISKVHLQLMNVKICRATLSFDDATLQLFARDPPAGETNVYHRGSVIYATDYYLQMWTLSGTCLRIYMVKRTEN